MTSVEGFVGLAVLIVAGMILLPMIFNGPEQQRRREGITVWDEAWARREITTEQLYEIRDLSDE